MANAINGHCKLCGLITNRNYFNFLDVPQVNYTYINPICNLSDIKGRITQNIIKPTNSEEMKNFLLYVAGTKFLSVNQVYQKRIKIPENLVKMFTRRE